LKKYNKSILNFKEESITHKRNKKKFFSQSYVKKKKKNYVILELILCICIVYV